MGYDMLGDVNDTHMYRAVYVAFLGERTACSFGTYGRISCRGNSGKYNGTGTTKY